MSTLAQQVENRLLQSAIAGSKPAFDELVECYYQKIFYMIYAKVQDKVLAKDITQDVMIKICKNFQLFENRASFSTWIYRITENTIKNHYREMKLRTLSELQYCENDFSDDRAPEEDLYCQDIMMRFEATLAQLPIEMQQSYQWFIEGKSYIWIAEKMACPIGTVRSRISRARQLLKKGMMPGYLSRQ